jgi:hypothetical protein
MLRVFAFCLLFVSALMTPLWLFVLCTVAYMVYFGPVEPMIIAVLIDAQFGEPVRSFPYVYTVITVTLAVLIRTVRPLLRI